MSLISRRPRPIPRDEGKLRDARLFVIATEDTYAPKQYFAFFGHPRIHVEVLGTSIGEGQDPSSVINRLIKFAEEYQITGDDQLWAFLDTDHWIRGNHKKGLIQAIDEARQRGYKVAMSRPCFDLWLLLHHEEVAPGTIFANCDAVGSRIRTLRGEFNKTNLKREHYTLLQVEVALARAKALDTHVSDESADFWPETTATRIHLLMNELKIAGLLNPVK
jgi:RloB-like protein